MAGRTKGDPPSRWRRTLDKWGVPSVTSSVGSVVALFILGILGVFKRNATSPLLWVSLLSATAIMLSVTAIALVRRFGTENTGTSNSPRLRTHVYAGIDVGRHQLTYGVLYAHDRSSGLPGPDATFQRGGQRRGRVDRNTFFYQVPRIVEGIDADHIDGLGIGFPAEVDAQSGTAIGTPGTFHDPEYIRRELANCIARHAPAAMKFGVEPAASHEEKVRHLERVIYVDNDVNCAARAILNDHQADVGTGNLPWRNFACVYVGHTGVGAGLILNGSMYYGNSGAAGEIGHVTVDYSEDAKSAPPSACECGSDADSVHWQTLVNSRGLAELAARLDTSLYNRLRQAAVDTRDGDDALALEDTLMGTGPFRGDHAMTAYSAAVVCSHARYLAMGLASLMNLLDLDHVILGGGMIESFWKLSWADSSYRTALQLELANRILPAARQNLFYKIDYDGAVTQRNPSWKGGALLFCDPTYVALLNSVGNRNESAEQPH